MKSKTRVASWASFLLLVVAVLLIFEAIDGAVTGSPGDLSPRAKFQLPKLFSFQEFKGIFKKSYDGVVEALVRQKIYLARATKVFLSAVKYKFGAQSYYLKINQKSDYTSEELDASRSKLLSLRQRKPEPVPMVDIKEVEQSLAEVSKRSDEPGFAEIAQELKGAKESGSRRRRSVVLDVIPERELSLDQLVGESPDSVEESPEVEAKQRLVIPSNNPNYQPVDYMSFGSEISGRKLRSGENYMEMLGSKLANVRVSDEIEDTATKLIERRHSPRLAARSKGKNEMFVDHRRTGCLFKPRDQDQCGSCYAFATVALLEYLHCLETGELVAFSEQYFLDCGADQGLTGCDGGYLDDAMQFPIENGIELRSMYPYLGQQTVCPFEAAASKSERGYLRMGTRIRVNVEDHAEMERHLESTPMMTLISTQGDFHEYGGGVHEVGKCDEGDHAVLLVGHGREDGKEFWLIRNSHSTSFGEGGYYKLAKESNCLFEGGWFFKTRNDEYGIRPHENKHHNAVLVETAIEKYLRQKAYAKS